MQATYSQTKKWSIATKFQEWIYALINFKLRRRSVSDAGSQMILGIMDQLKIETQKRQELESFIRHIGYTIHHMGNDLMNGSEGAINLTNKELRSQRGQIMSRIGNYMRMIDQPHGAPSLLDKMSLHGIATIFGNASDGEDYEKRYSSKFSVNTDKLKEILSLLNVYEFTWESDNLYTNVALSKLFDQGYFGKDKIAFNKVNINGNEMEMEVSELAKMWATCRSSQTGFYITPETDITAAQIIVIEWNHPEILKYLVLGEF